MTTVTVPDELLTIEDWDALEETDANRRWQLADGLVAVAPFPSLDHQEIVTNLTIWLREHLPADVRAIPGVAVTIEAGFPPTVRGPDVTVLVRARPRTNVLRVDPADVRLVAEFVSPGSRRLDRVTKVSEYQDVGIPLTLDVGALLTLD
ncbi:Uma2 family endonuclease [Jiangella asiatica]|nr:Uma2 family endonuclease [Jiangella asiatica]